MNKWIGTMSILRIRDAAQLRGRQTMRRGLYGARSVFANLNVPASADSRTPCKFFFFRTLAELWWASR